MARPRIFISSTYYDLRQVREDLDRFVRSLGYESVRHETGRIPYTKDEKLEVSAYRELEFCDILVCIIGGRFGTESQENTGFSITQTELKKAVEKNIPVYVFVERSVLSEYSTYLLNKENQEIKYRHADDIRVYQYLESIHALPKNNPISGFGTSSDITSFLSEQWAGLFQRFLQQQQRITEIHVLEEMNAISKTMRDLVTFLTEEKKSGDEAIKSILLSNHPVFGRLAKITKTGYRVYFTDHEEMEKWLKARTWEPIDSASYFEGSVEEWVHDKYGYLVFRHEIFDDNGRLKVFTEFDWNEDWLELIKPQKQDSDDDIPF